MPKSSATNTKKANASGRKVDKELPGVRKVAEKAKDLATNPIVAEIVAATLVAAAAALKDPAKARALADSVADELDEASKTAATKSGAFWQLALDIARRSVDSLNSEKKVNKPAKSDSAGSKKASKPKKADKSGKTKKAKKSG